LDGNEIEDFGVLEREKYNCRCSRRTLAEVANNCMGHEPNVVQRKGRVNEWANNRITIKAVFLVKK
jgi:hypothetical protein